MILSRSMDNLSLLMTAAYSASVCSGVGNCPGKKEGAPIQGGGVNSLRPHIKKS